MKPNLSSAATQLTDVTLARKVPGFAAASEDLHDERNVKLYARIAEMQDRTSQGHSNTREIHS